MDYPKSVKDLCSAPKNPRKIQPLALHGLDQSMRNFGDLSGIVFNVRTGHLVSGHQRVKTLPESLTIESVHEEKDESGTVGYGSVRHAGSVFPVRLVDWDENREYAANLAANNPGIQGDFTDDVGALLAEIEQELPEIYDATRLFEIGDAKEDEGVSDYNKKPAADPNEYPLSQMPYENINYLVLLFKNSLDWNTAKDHFGLVTRQDPTRKVRRLGLGHVIDGAEYLTKVLEVMNKANIVLSEKESKQQPEGVAHASKDGEDRQD